MGLFDFITGGAPREVAPEDTYRGFGGFMRDAIDGGNFGRSRGQEFAPRSVATPQEDYSFIRDMFDGGGMGRSGSHFVGSPISGLLNAIGVRPMGYSPSEAAPVEYMGTSGGTAQPAPRPRAARYPNYGPPRAMTYPTYGPPGSARRPQTMPGILPTAAYEPLRYEPPAVTADYFTTPPPQASYTPVPTTVEPFQRRREQYMNAVGLPAYMEYLDMFRPRSGVQ